MRQSELEESFSKGDPDMPSLPLAQSYHGRISSKILAPLTWRQPFPLLFCSPYCFCFYPFLIGWGWGGVGKGVLLLKTVWEGSFRAASCRKRMLAGSEGSKGF